MKNKYRHPSDIIQSQGNDTLNFISNRLSEIEVYTQSLKKIQNELLEKCILVNINNNIITLSTEYFHIVHEIKYRHDSLLKVLHNEYIFSNITRIKIIFLSKKDANNIKAKTNSNIQKKNLSTKNLKALCQLKTETTSDPLKTSLKKLLSKYKF